VFFDVFRHVNLNYGDLQAADHGGSSSGGNQYDIVPGHAGRTRSCRSASTRPTVDADAADRAQRGGERGGRAASTTGSTRSSTALRGSGCASEYP
jgi:hypothetical protein